MSQKKCNIEYHVNVDTKTYETELYWRTTYIKSVNGNGNGSVNENFIKTFPEFIGYAINIHRQSNGFCCSFNDLEMAHLFKRRIQSIYEDEVKINIFSTQPRRDSCRF